ncbi:hypothetical protein KSF73_06315 [Burkholderiaceae bacterium DAT-1]|nr:hypothetical protein [Burkholderiaceae bacterium DAT-1]
MPEIQTMASGNLSLYITEDVTWENFPEKAQQFIRFSGGCVVKKIDTAAERMWIVLIRWRPFYLVYDDFPLGMSLDSMTSLCNPVIQQLFDKLSDSQG